MIGRTFSNIDADEREDEYIWTFVEMALEPEYIRDETESDEGFIDDFITRISHDKFQNSAKDSKKYLSSDDVQSFGMKINQTKFVSAYQKLDKSSGIGLVRLTSVTMPSLSSKLYLKDTSLLCYSLSGDGEILIDGKVHKCNKYDCVWISSNQNVQYRVKSNEAWECALIWLHGNTSSDMYERTCTRLKAEGSLNLTYGAGTRFRSLMWQILSLANEKQINTEETLSHLLLNLFIEIELSMISSLVKPHIVPDIIVSRQFKQYIGKSPNEYLIDLRINKSKGLLIDSNLSIAEIAALVGVANTNHFLYLFKNREGITPSAFRKHKV